MGGVGCGELTYRAWAVLAPLLPPGGGRGTPWADHRRVINGILGKLRTGSPWRDLPERYPPWQTCHARLGRGQRDGTGDRLLAHVQTKSDAAGEVEWAVSVDSTVVRAHQHAAGARKKGAARTRPRTTQPMRPLGPTTRRSGAAAGD